MFSTAQLDLARGLIAKYKSIGYNYYAMIQEPSSGYNNPYDMQMLFSKTAFDYDLVNGNYQFVAPADCIGVRIASGNFNTSNSSQRIVAMSVPEGQLLEIPSYLHLATNLQCVDTMEFVPDYGGVVNAQTEAGGLLFMFTIFVFLFAFLRLFRR